MIDNGFRDFRTARIGPDGEWVTVVFEGPTLQYVADALRAACYQRDVAPHSWRGRRSALPPCVIVAA